MEIVVIIILLIYIFLPLDFREAPHLIVPRAPRTLTPALRIDCVEGDGRHLLLVTRGQRAGAHQGPWLGQVVP